LKRRAHEHDLPVRSELAALETSSAFVLVRVISLTASATAEFGTSTMTSTCAWSYQRRAMSALF